MGKNSYIGGGTIIDTGPHGDPGGKGVGGRRSPSLKGSQRMTDRMLAARIPAMREALGLIVELERQKLARFQDIRQIVKHHAVLAAFDETVRLEHRLAFDNGKRLTGEALSPIERSLGCGHPALARIRALRKYCS